MKLAIKKAWENQGFSYPNPSVGAVIVDGNGKILSVATNNWGKAHAEVNATRIAYGKLHKKCKIKDATKLHNFLCENHNGLFEDCTIYVTLEPCNHYGKTPPCSLLIESLNFKRVVVAIKDTNKIAVGGIKRLKDCAIKVTLGICENEAKKLIFPFKKWNSGNFIFFKLALSLNGIISPGIITSQTSRKMVHKLRDKIDLLVIGGNTVRVDNPILDSRLVGGNVPDILIYSRQKNFDKNLKLFKVKNREVYIENNFEKLKNYKYIMIEGGETMLKSCEKIIDCYLIFQSPHFKSGNGINYNLKLSKLNSYTNRENDIVNWLKT